MKKTDKVHTVMSEFKRGKLHSGSKHGPLVRSRKQAVAIAMSEAGLTKKNPAPPFGHNGCFTAKGMNAFN
jgi:hypothetical protein